MLLLPTSFALLPPAHSVAAARRHAVPVAAESPPSLTLHRERNGWCIGSAQLWLALEHKNLRYETVRVLASDAPALHWPDGTVQTDSVTAIRALDAAHPAAVPLWPPAGIEAARVTEMVDAFDATMPDARESTRAAYLFCREEGFHYDPLPRETFVATLDETERLLGLSPGPFFCGGSFSAADVVWAPVLERYAAQLPCLHRGLRPRGGGAWPRLARWYAAMERGVPAYACRVRGDAPSWRKMRSATPPRP